MEQKRTGSLGEREGKRGGGDGEKEKDRGREGGVEGERGERGRFMMTHFHVDNS